MFGGVEAVLQDRLDSLDRRVRDLEQGETSRAKGPGISIYSTYLTGKPTERPVARPCWETVLTVITPDDFWDVTRLHDHERLSKEEIRTLLSTVCRHLIAEEG